MSFVNQSTATRHRPPLYRQPTDLSNPTSNKRGRSPEPQLTTTTPSSLATVVGSSFLEPVAEESLNRDIPPRRSSRREVHHQQKQANWVQQGFSRFLGLFVRYSSSVSPPPRAAAIVPSSAAEVVPTHSQQQQQPRGRVSTVFLTPHKKVTKHRSDAMSTPSRSGAELTKPSPAQPPAHKPAWDSPVRVTAGGRKQRAHLQSNGTPSHMLLSPSALLNTSSTGTARTLPLSELSSSAFRRKPTVGVTQETSDEEDDDDEEQRPGRARYLIDDALSVAQLCRLVPSLQVQSSQAEGTAQLAMYVRQDLAMRDVYDAVLAEAVSSIVATRSARCVSLVSALTEAIVTSALRPALRRHVPPVRGVLRMLRLQQQQIESKKPVLAALRYELSDEDLSYVSKIMRPANDSVLIDKDGFKITRSQLSTVFGTSWLNDQVINYFFHLLASQGPGCHRTLRPLAVERGSRPEVITLGSHVYTRIAVGDISGALRWVRRQDSIFNCRAVLVPVNIQNTHWVLVVVQNETRRLEYYDSMQSTERTHAQEILNNVATFMQAAWDSRHGVALSDAEAPHRTTQLWSAWERRTRSHNPADWADDEDGCDRAQPPAVPKCLKPHNRRYDRWPLIVRDDAPRQQNGYDCGVYVCQNGLCAAVGASPIGLTQEDITNLRQVMPLELLQGKLLVRSSL